MRAIEGPLAAVRDVRPESLAYDGPAERLPGGVDRGAGRAAGVLEQVTVADVARGRLPRRDRAADRGPGGVEGALTEAWRASRSSRVGSGDARSTIVA